MIHSVDAFSRIQPFDERPLVLVVEDDLGNRALLARLLEREGYRTVSASDRALVPLFVMEIERDREVILADLPPSALLPTA